VAVDPVLALLTVAVVANLVLMGVLIVPVLLGRRGTLSDAGAAGDRLTGAVRMAAVDGRPEPGLIDAGVPQGAYDRIVRIVTWVALLAIAAIVAVSGLWPDTQVAILVLLASAGLFVVVVHDLLPPQALGSAKFVVEGSVGITFAALLVLLTGQEASPFFFTFALIVAGAALVVSPGVTVALAAAASFGYLAAVLLPVDPDPLSAMAVATIGINLTALLLLTYVAMVIAREQRRSRDRAIHLSTVDALTGLFNRSFLFAAVEREIARSGRSGRGFCVLMMDLDGLKAVNDRFGHHVGDKLLRSVGDEIRTGVRRIDTPARYGGDEFVVLCPETDPTGAYILAEKIRLGIAELSVDGPGEPIRPSVSVGVVTWPSDGATADALLISADQAMYASKRAGKDRVTSAAPTERVAEPVPGDAAGTSGTADEATASTAAQAIAVEPDPSALGSPIAVEADPDVEGDGLPGSAPTAESEARGPSAGRV
jgi:diguanylate cyclase (GGDEF)-like protein